MSPPDVIGLMVMMEVRFPLSLQNVEDLKAERGIHIAQILALLSRALPVGDRSPSDDRIDLDVS
ncbi:hypothetical protein SZ64_00750 [Erythrobacter sp. SG61-1L]|nr:hypothetical protein SZ64_00750 [Erythrobacter sp. SG61-1L]